LIFDDINLKSCLDEFTVSHMEILHDSSKHAGINFQRAEKIIEGWRLRVKEEGLRWPW
jgi:hypothetical protein